jgi:RNA polymerase sigma-70 factor (ECF subfamily)
LKLEEEQLIEACKENKRQACNELYELYSKKLLGICLRYTRNLSEAEDVLHDAFIKVFTKIDQYSGKGSFEGWLKRITANTAIQYLRNRAKNDARFSAREVETINVEEDDEDVIPAIPAKELMKMIQDLPDGYRIIFNMYVFEEMSHKEIAEVLQINENTSKSQFHRAKLSLRKMVNRYLKSNI